VARQAGPITLDPVAAYDRIAPVYASLAEQRKPYLDSVDRIVIAEISPGSRSLLDVGAGDGTRARRIAQSRGISELALVEPSEAMQRATHRDPGPINARAHTMRAEDLHLLQAEFEIITCLWNVLGHISQPADRVEVLRQFARLLTPGGKIFVDVNHRYNARHYGLLPTAMRFLHDRLLHGEKNGDVVVSWDVGGTRCATLGHVFTHQEVQGLCRSAGLKIEKTFVVDYATGQLRRWKFEGHLLYVLRASN
jgi:2-polyprenyl-3-methyl-5-hydroxy-6-metoxy-1,4-benzoquinol methylase